MCILSMTISTEARFLAAGVRFFDSVILQTFEDGTHHRSRYTLHRNKEPMLLAKIIAIVVQLYFYHIILTFCLYIYILTDIIGNFSITLNKLMEMTVHLGL